MPYRLTAVQRQVIRFLKKNTWPCSRHAWKPRQKWPSTPPRSRYRPATSLAVVMAVGSWGRQQKPNEATHKHRLQNPGNVSYVSCILYVRVSLEGANFWRIYYHLLSILSHSKAFKALTKKTKTHHLHPSQVHHRKTHNFPFGWETKSASASPRMDSWVFSRATLVKSPANGTNRGTRGSTQTPGSWGIFFWHNAWRTMERKQRDQSSRFDK